MKLKEIVGRCWWVGGFNSLKKTNQLVSNTLLYELLSTVRLIVQSAKKQLMHRMESKFSGEVDCADLPLRIFPHVFARGLS